MAWGTYYYFEGILSPIFRELQPPEGQQASKREFHVCFDFRRMNTLLGLWKGSWSCNLLFSFLVGLLFANTDSLQPSMAYSVIPHFVHFYINKKICSSPFLFCLIT